MPNKQLTTVQGQMWDQIALARLNSELAMTDVARANVEEADCLEFAGEVKLAVPEAGSVEPVRNLPPWERM